MSWGIATRAACRAAAACVVGAALAAPAFAKDRPSAVDLAALPLDALLDLEVTGASKFAQRMSETAASVTLIGAAEIRALGHRSLADVLRTVRGLMVGTDRTYDYLGVRGFFSAGDYNTRVLLLIDGNRVNDNLYDQAYIGDEFPLDVSRIERVEFVPGQGSAVYGANALFGVVNVITREAGNGPRLAAGGALGSGERRQLHASGRSALGDGALQWAASRRLARGHDVFDPTRADPPDDGWSRDTDYERRSALHLRYDAGAFSAALVHADRLKGTPMYPGQVYGDPRNAYRDTQTLAHAEWRRPLGAASELTARAFAGHYDFRGHFVLDYPPPTLNVDVSHGRWWGVEARVLSAAFERHKWVAGVELQRSSELTQLNFDLDPPVAYLDDRRDGWRAALFVEDQVRLSPTLGATFGVRADRSDGHDTELSPRVGLNWRADDALVVKALHGRAFRPPNAFEAYYEVAGPGGYRRNPALGAEKVSGSELALEWWPGGEARVVAALFRNRANRLLMLDYDAEDDVYEFRNLGRLASEGIELEAERGFGGGARLRANVTLQRTHGAEATASAFPRKMAKLVAIWPLPAACTLGLELQAMSRRGAAPGHAVANLTLATPAPRAGWGASLTVRNLFGRALTDPGFDPRRPQVPLAGREWLLTADYAF